MSHTDTPSDEQLSAYLDGELSADQHQRIADQASADPALAARLDALRCADLPFKAAFDTVLEHAPTERLHAMLNALPPAPPQAWSRRRFLAVAASFTVAGVAADRLFLGWQRTEPGQGWRASVAEYMALYTPQTLENLSLDPASHTAQLTAVGALLGVSLSPESVSLPGAEFRRAQILDYDGVLIGQLTYLDPRHGPLALCITASKKGMQPLASEQRRGLNVVYWANPAHAFMLIGRNPVEDLQHMAIGVESRLPA